MGFRKDGYATIWDIKPMSDFCTQVRLSTGHRNKDSGEYEQDYSGFVRFVGSANAKSALALKRRDRIKIGDCEVTTRYDKNSKKEYTNFLIYNFQKLDGDGSAGGRSRGNSEPAQSDPEPNRSLPF